MMNDSKPSEKQVTTQNLETKLVELQKLTTDVLSLLDEPIGTAFQRDAEISRLRIAIRELGEQHESLPFLKVWAAAVLENR